MRKSVDENSREKRMECRKPVAWKRLDLAKSSGPRAANPRKEPRRQALVVLQHEAFVGRIAKKLFHRLLDSNVLPGRQLRALSLSLRIGFSENRMPLFGPML
jgi:hypothetical protein